MENEKKTPAEKSAPKHKKHKPYHKKSYFIEPATPEAKEQKKKEQNEAKPAPTPKEAPAPQKAENGGGEKKQNHRPHHNKHHRRNNGGKPRQNERPKTEEGAVSENLAPEVNEVKEQKKEAGAPAPKQNTGSSANQNNQQRHNNNNRKRKNKNHRDRNPFESNEKTLSLSLGEEEKKPIAAPEEEETPSVENMTLEEILGEVKKEESPVEPVEEEDVPMVEVVGIRFKSSGKIYYFDPAGEKYSGGKHAIVETARGQEYGEIVFGNKMVKESDTVPPLRPVIRSATEADIQHHKENKEKEDAAFKICNEKIISHGLDMKLIDVQYTFDNTKLLFYFTSAGRVDFRELVKDLASVFRTRIELRQIGIRDEAKMMGGLGPCGRSLCCSIFLSDFGQVSIKMAKEQNLSLNSSKISGVCGRLMCCLRYEYETYEQEIKLTPPVESVVKTADGVGTVTEINPLAATIKVRLHDTPDVAPKTYHRDDVTVLQKKRPQPEEQ